MASYELVAFDLCTDIRLVAGVVEQFPSRLDVAFWVTDPLQRIVYPTSLTQAERCDRLWQQTCFEIFLGLKGEHQYREVNVSPSGAWQLYQFEEYRYPDTDPPVYANDVELIQIQRTRYGVNVALDLNSWLKAEAKTLSDVYIGLSAVINTSTQSHFFAMQHSGQQADFHNKRDWLHQV